MADFRQLRYFVTLAETLHFGRAAERLHVTQPPLSRQIAALEKSLGVKLFERDTKHTRLTHAGRQFLEDAKATLVSFDQACRNARLAEAGQIGELKIGFMMHAAFTVLPSLARRFVSAHPQVKIHLMEVIPSSLPDEVLNGRFDAGIMFPVGKTKGLEFQAVHSERLCLAVPESHRLASRSRIRPKDLKDEALIAAPENVSPVLRDTIVRWFRTDQVNPVFRLETQLQQTIVSLVAEELGVALVPESMKKAKVDGVVFRGLAEPPSIEHAIAWRPANLNPALPHFLNLVRQGKSA